MITEDYCSYEVAKLLKEKGFNEKCVAYYPQCITPIKLTFGGRVNYNSSNKFKMLPPISAPTHQMAMKWLREVHNIDIIAPPQYDSIKWTYSAIIFKLSIPCTEIRLNDNKDKKEEAVESALNYTLKNLI